MAQPHQPYVSATSDMKELTVRAVVLGSLLAMVFAAADAYLGLRIGMTVSASIPAAVISMAILRGLLKNGTVLENNIVQTIASSGESLAAGVIFTVPALIFIGATPSLGKIFALTCLGGFLGTLMMIPLRRLLIVQEHETLPFPEGVACAEVLRAGDTGGSQAWLVLWGLLTGGIAKFAGGALKLWTETPSWDIRSFGTKVGVETSPSLLGVGLIIGPRIAGVMFAGGALGWLVLIPLLHYIGAYVSVPVPPGTEPLASMDPDAIWSKYIRYIGAGAVAFGGMVSIVRSFPSMVRAFTAKRPLQLEPTFKGDRTDRDLSPWVVYGGSALCAIALWLWPDMGLSFLGAVLCVIACFLFVSVATRIVGLIGASSSPVSGMTICGLLAISAVLKWSGMEVHTAEVMALTIGAVLCVSICMSEDISQDLKTGYLIGATPRNQQLSEFAGILLPAAVIGGTVFLLDKAYHLGSPALPAPQANLMALLVRGVMEGTLPWVLVICGAAVGLTVELMGIGSLPFAIGLYLPFSLSVPILLGGGLAWLLKQHDGRARGESMTLVASGLVAGDALTGIAIAGVVYYGGENAMSLGPLFNATADPIVATAGVLTVLGIGAWLTVKKRT